MTVTYLFRSPGTGHSIEELFGCIQQRMDQQANVTTTALRLPHVSRSLRDVWRNIRFMKRQSIGDLVHITGDAHYVALAVPGSRTVLTIHDCITLDRNRARPIRYILFWLLWFYWPVCRAAVVTVPSEKTRQELIRYLGRIAGKAVVVPNGYGPDCVWQPRLWRPNRPVLLQIGTAPHKNLMRVAEAIEGLDCLLLIVGPLSRDKVAELTARRIRYENYVDLSRAEIIHCYVDCDIVLFVSTYEGFGMPILEANAIGRVVIASDQSPMREVAGPAAHLVDPTDLAAIRSGIRRVLHDDAYRQRLIEAGRANAQRHTMDQVVTSYSGIYQQLMACEFLTERVG